MNSREKTLLIRDFGVRWKYVLWLPAYLGSESPLMHSSRHSQVLPPSTTICIHSCSEHRSVLHSLSLMKYNLKTSYPLTI